MVVLDGMLLIVSLLWVDLSWGKILLGYLLGIGKGVLGNLLWLG